ncbi:heavy-metal-associated domain-containing protein [Ktedonobacter robiniae]|uniref:heavy-metal-associated domain-containing protein n=1 Tax=Ktedonobacter robiniae TaxID=2778365 RepID=UPI00191692FD|nr:heavy-metal-associated domain-containing protein [Ktedonobacter robiniae]
MQTTMRLTLPKIGCQGCMKKVVNVLSALPEVEIVQTDVPSKTVVLSYPAEEISLTQIEGELDKIKHIIGNAEPCAI